MAKLSDIAKGYAERLRNTVRSERAAEYRRIVVEIDNLVYTATSQRIDDAVKLQMYEAIKSEVLEWLKIEVAFSAGSESRVLLECANDELMVLINTIEDKLRG